MGFFRPIPCDGIVAWWKRRGTPAAERERHPDLPLIRLDGVTKIFKGDADEETRALDGVTLDIDRGEYISVSGPSGCGKSTLLSLLALLDAPTGGRYWFDGRRMDQATPSEKARIRNIDVGLVFQSFNLIGDMTVSENVEYPLTLRGISREDRPSRVDAALARVRLTARATQRRGSVWGGHRQLVAIARDHRTAPIVLAEPTAQSRFEEQRSGDGDLEDLQRDGSTVCIATHDPRHIARATRHLYLFDGRLVDHPVA
jgi:putative ABC transport system ATP-binding protein